MGVESDVGGLESKLKFVLKVKLRDAKKTTS